MSVDLLQLETAPQTLLHGRSKLFVVEPNKDLVCAPRKRIVRRVSSWPSEPYVLATTTLGHAKSELSLREWDFYTALTKTELTYSLPDDDAASRSFGAYLQHRGLLKWNPDNLRLAQSGVFSRKDSARTSLAGRFGEALMYLYMVDAGYPFWDHLPSLAERLMERYEYSRDDKLRIARILSRPTRPDGKRVREPDYVFDDGACNVALAEAKGAFVNPDDSPSMVKGDLSNGLAQLQLWQRHVSPIPQRSFAIGSYLREASDRYPDPSLLAVVDPEGEGDEVRALDFPRDWIRRGNYAAWMRGMRLNVSAELLAYGRYSELPRRGLATIEVSGRSFAITPIRYVVAQPGRRRPHDLDMLFLHPHLGWHDVHVLGIDVNTLRNIEKAVNVTDAELPTEMNIDIVPVARLPDWFSGSIMPDGTLNAILHFDGGPQPLGIEEFRL